jgi:hypothetical protein
MGSMKWIALAVTALGVGSQEIPSDDRLYGRVTTAAGDVYEGYLRWDRNEGSWADVLNGTKELPWQNARDAERLDEEMRYRRHRERSVSVLGLRISWSEDGDDYPESASSGIRFGHLRTLVVVGDDRALLTLKSGQELELEGGSTDLGDELRELVVDDPERGEIELRWRDIDEVEFMAAPRSLAGPRATRLYGTLMTRHGEEFTGFVSWDVDEILGSDVLDGEERGRDRKIPFDRIAAIERAGSSGAYVILRTGEEIHLRDSNDVDDSNRGIAVTDPALGQVEVDWDAFEQVTFFEPPSGTGSYDAFDGGRPLRGTVVTEDGARHTGWVRWDNDEEYSWEILDGWLGDVDVDVELGNVERIARLGSWGSEVTLFDGSVLELEGSNDVDEDNKGVFVTLDEGETVLVPWWDFRELTFEGR